MERWQEEKKEKSKTQQRRWRAEGKASRRGDSRLSCWEEQRPDMAVEEESSAHERKSTEIHQLTN